MHQFKEECYGIFSVSLYDERSCRTIVHSIKRSTGWYDARVRNEVSEGKYRSARMARVRKARILNPGAAESVYVGFDRKINLIVKPMIRRVWRADLLNHSDTQVIRYAPNGHYQEHTDSGYDLSDRYFSVLCYLNDDFEGGHTSFPYLNFSAVPKRGRAIVFPSSYMHCAEPVLSGEKFVALTWVMGPPWFHWF